MNLTPSCISVRLVPWTLPQLVAPVHMHLYFYLAVLWCLCLRQGGGDSCAPLAGTHLKVEPFEAH